MSSLVKIATQRLAGRSIDEIAAALDTSVQQIRMIERIGVARVRAAYHKANALGDVAYDLQISGDDVRILDEAYRFTTSKKPEPVPYLFDMPAHRGVGADVKLTALPKAHKNKSEATPRQKRKQSGQQSTQQPEQQPKQQIAVPQQTSFVQKILPPSQTADTSNSASRNHASYRQVRNILEPYTREMFVNAHDANALLNSEQVRASPYIIRSVLTDLSGGLVHGDRVRSWAKKYAQQGRTLVEIARLLGNQHPFATKKLLASLDLHVRDGFELIDYQEVLRAAKSLPQKQQTEIELICRGASYKKLSEQQGYTQTRAGQRISELGLREIWQCAQYLRRATTDKTIVIIT